ncbi:MAG TPA: hypothetical protein VFR23_25080 [Jiangellaceae bacterium]|nr:hypothetical protein [Jiangellaceae bacterium]
MAKQNATVELFYDGAWNVAPVYIRDPITITRGRGSESGEAEPATCSLVLDNRDGTYSPLNPSSPLFGVAGRNTPIRVSLTEATDAFGRTVVGSWGTSDTGQAWSQFGAGGTVDADDFEVETGVGKHHLEVDNAYRVTYLDDVSMRDVGVVVTTDPIVANVLGNALEPANILLRGQSTTEYYMARVSVSASEVVTAQLFHSTGGSLGSAQTVTGLTYDGSPLKVRAEIYGPHLRMKVWLASGAEPAGWHASATDTTLTAAGWVGIRSGVASGNTNTKPTEFAYDNLAVYDIRFSGEVSSWRPRRSLDFDSATGKGDAWAEITASGVLRRVGQGSSPLRSALTRSILRGNPANFSIPAIPIAYWPLEDEKDATRPGSAVPGGIPLNTRGVIEYGTEVPIPGSAPLAKLADSTSRIFGTVLDGAYPSTWDVNDGTAFSWAMAIGDETANAPLLEAQISDSAGFTWGVTMALDGTTDIDIAVSRWPTEDPGAATVLASSIWSDVALADYLMFHLIFDQDGSDLEWFLFGSSSDTGGVAVSMTSTITGGDLGKVRTLQFDASSTLDNLRLGHMVVHDTNTISVSAMFDNTAGYAGEAADERVDRLCTEEGVAFTLFGTAGDGGLMGPQRIASLDELLRDPERVDQGILFDPRTSLGLAYRTLVDLYNQTAALTLDHTAGHIAPLLEPDLDDQGVRNDVEVKRVDGSSARVTLDEGALSTQAPPDGVGRYDESLTVNAQFDTQLEGIAGWRLGLGTVEGTRYPKVTVDLDAPDVTAALIADASAVEIGDLITIANLPADDTPDDVHLIVRGYTETIGSHRRTITYNTTPAGPYEVGVWDEEGVSGRYDSAYSTLAAEFEAGVDTSMSVAVESLRKLWVTGSGTPQFPLDILVSGARLRVTAISGATSPQTFTITQAPINGVEKVIPSGTQVRAWLPGRWAMGG